MKTVFFIFSAAIIISCIAACSKSSDTTPPVTNGPYFPQVRTIIQAHCLSCHNPGGMGMPVLLNSDTMIVQYAAAIKAAVHDPVSPVNHRMPQGSTLADADINTIVNWYNAGGVSTVSKVK